MELLKTLQSCKAQGLAVHPEISHTNLFKRVAGNCYLEFVMTGEKILYSPYYTLLRGEESPELSEFISGSEDFLDRLKSFLTDSLYAYTAIIEANSYYLSSNQDIFIARLLNYADSRLLVKFYSHNANEIAQAYDDKIYIGRDFIDLHRFERDAFGLPCCFQSLLDQNDKLQERAQKKLRYYQDYKKTYLDEIDYLSREACAEMEKRLKFFPGGAGKVPRTRLQDISDHLLYLQNIVIELRDFTAEFEYLLRQREENSFVKQLTKFTVDIKNTIKYCNKLNYFITARLNRFNLV